MPISKRGAAYKPGRKGVTAKLSATPRFFAKGSAPAQKGSSYSQWSPGARTARRASYAQGLLAGRRAFRAAKGPSGGSFDSRVERTLDRTTNLMQPGRGSFNAGIARYQTRLSSVAYRGTSKGARRKNHYIQLSTGRLAGSRKG